MDDQPEDKAPEEPTAPREPGDPEATPHTTGELEAAATREGGGPTGGLGILFIAAGLALAMVLGLVAVFGYFALKH
ncbi:MAG: hypothetical protein ABI193_15175 [Minicystis sp.]